MQTRSFWGWGYDEYEIPKEVIVATKQSLQMAFDIRELEEIEPPKLEDLQLRKPRFALPEDLQGICTDATYDRAAHSYGKSFRDIWRGLHGQFHNPPDYVAYPKDEAELKEVMDFASQNDIALIPFGGGSSVVGGVEPTESEDFRGVITLDMKHFDQVLEIDHHSRCARIQAGIFGPALEAALKPHGLTMRHYPQSFEFSTLGGWIATRSGGHFATLYTHIDEFVQGVRMLTPNGVWETRRLPGSGAGPSEERLICGSEGVFGVITEAWVRLQTIPTFKKTVTVHFDDFMKASEACRQLAQTGLNPTNARLISPFEAFFNGLGSGKDSVLIVGFESHHHDVSEKMQLALEVCGKCGGNWKDTPKKTELATSKSATNQKANAWKASFLRAPYMRDELMRFGLILETFETAVTWDQFEVFHKAVEKAARDAVKEHCGVGLVTCRFTHLYTDGPAPYYTVMAKGKKGQEMAQWDAIKAAVSQAIIDNGGTITHHHAVGKDHAPYYKQQQSEPFERILKGIKAVVDEKGVMNPGVLFGE
ncbi:MAG: FAD-binding oxidoreductase [Chitinophagales bacterium]